MNRSVFISVIIVCTAFTECPAKTPTTSGTCPDMLTPQYYTVQNSDPFKKTVGRFIYFAHRCQFHHPLENPQGKTPDFYIPFNGRFGAGKGPSGTQQHHPASDLHVYKKTNVMLYAAHDGFVETYKDAKKYRHYLSISKLISDPNGQPLGKIVTIYAHLDLDLDEADGISMNKRFVKKGELVSKHLYADTVGGPHLHFEIRYYRPGDTGTETFYGFYVPRAHSELTEPSAGPWSYGYWNPTVGYGFGDPKNHGLSFQVKKRNNFRKGSRRNR